MDNSLDLLNLLHPKLRQSAIDCYNKSVQATPVGIHPYIVQTIRSFGESDDLYALGRTKVNPDGQSPNRPLGNIVTNAPAGSSYHNYGLALDFGLIVDGKISYIVNKDWMTVVNIFESAGFTWGGTFASLVDDPHLENRFGYNWRQLKELHDTGKFIPGTNYVQI